MNKEHKVSVYDMTKQLNLKEVIPEINTREIFITQAEINRPALQLAGFFEHFSKQTHTDHRKCGIPVSAGDPQR